MRISQSTSFRSLRSVMIEMAVNDEECRALVTQCNAHALNTSVTLNSLPFTLHSIRAIEMSDIRYT